MKRHRALRSTAALLVGWVVVRGTILATVAAPETAAVIDRKATAPSVPPPILVKYAVPAEQLAMADAQIPKPENTRVAKSIVNLEAESLRLASRKAAKVENFSQIATAAIVQAGQVARGKEGDLAVPGVDAFPETQRSSASVLPLAPLNLAPRTRFLSPSGSAWALVRGRGGRSGLATNGQLGGSQIGARIAVPVSLGKWLPAFALHGRLSTALETPHQSEAGVGMLLPVKAGLPVQLILERRIRISQGGRNAFAAIVATGFDDRVVLGGMRASGYAQAGMVGMRSRDGFVDGAFRLETPVSPGRSSGLRLGGGVWGAAQPGIYRVDVGPRMARDLVIGGRRAKATLEWRQRIAGHALPPSGLTVTIGSDF